MFNSMFSLYIYFMHIKKRVGNINRDLPFPTDLGF